MQPGLLEVQRFLLDCPPFDELNGEQRQWVAGQIKAAYVNEHNVDGLFKQHSPALYIVRSGGFDLLAPDGHLIERLESHDLFGFPSLLSGRAVVNKLQVIEDGIIYIITAAVFDQLRQHVRAFEQYFIRAHEQRLLSETARREGDVGRRGSLTGTSSGSLQGSQVDSGAAERGRQGVAASRPKQEPVASYDTLQLPVAEVIVRAPVMLSIHATIKEAAERMRDEKVSSVLVVEGLVAENAAEGSVVESAAVNSPADSEATAVKLCGILTDRDLRNRVVAQGLAYDLQVNAVMTQAPATVYGRQTLMDALAIMTQENIHHLPVLNDADQPIGMITNTDLMRQQRSEPIMLISALNKAASKAQLVAEAAHIPAYMQTFAARVHDTTMVGRLLASLTDSMTRKLISLYEQEQGVAPGPYCWIAFGSQGREDQVLSSDQDNGLLLGNGLNDNQLDWFKGLGEYVSGGLHECGIPLCPGDIMASNVDCRRTLDGWLDRFKSWTESPTPKALMYCQIFFDSRLVYGNKRLYQRYREQVAGLARKDFFLGNLARLQVSVQVPLGLFNRFRGTESGKDSDLINIKRYGIALINDIVRIYSLQAGIMVPQTLARLEALKGSKLLNNKDNQSLAEAWQFLTELRLQHQLQTWGSDQPKNALDPDELSTLTRRQLKTAFRIIKECQQGVGLKFGRIG
ncbi:MAG: putative nucleotidyltransferase substrate binding domain-containing protein [Pseudidiomarina maritima]|nr:putative nucleotidyltransferase substrate binding domain-containing protein [Pseudidiomarina maritima]